MPEGYELSETTFGEVAIFDSKGEYCKIVGVDVPTLVSGEGQVRLKKAVSGDK